MQPGNPDGQALTDPESEQERRGASRKIGIVGLLLGFLLFGATLVWPPPDGMSPEAWRVAGLGLLMATWWITEAIPIPATALLPIPALPLLGVTTIEGATAPFANPVIFLFMGGFMLAQAMQRWTLHRRMAYGIIMGTGTAPFRLIAGFMLASAFLSMWVSNTAVAVMMLPVGLSVIQVVGGGLIEEGRPPGDPAFAVALLLGIAYGASIGGAATLIGTPPNALLAGYLLDQYGLEIGFAQWMVIGVPLSLILLPIAWGLLTRVSFHVDPEGPELAPDDLEGMKESLGAMSSGERRVAWVFGATAAAWIFRPLLQGLIPGLSDAGIAIAASLLLFVLPAGGAARAKLLNWDWARRIPWDILILFGGGLSLAAAITSSGLAGWIGTELHAAGRLPLLGLVTVTCILLVSLTELTSNTASAAAFLPILAGLAVALGEDPLFLLVPATLAASCAFMLPVATPPNAIVFGSTFIRIGHMVRAGVLLNLTVIALIPLLTFLLLRLFFGAVPGTLPTWVG